MLNRLDGCRVLELETNHGPAFIRNYLGEQARYPYLLFLDTDTSPVGEDFLSLYLKNAGGQVVCGGFCYPEEGTPFCAINTERRWKRNRLPNVVSILISTL